MGLLKSEPAQILACAIARDVQSFDLLIEDMEAELGDQWGGLDFNDGVEFLNTADAKKLDFIAIAVDQEDEAELSTVAALITAAKDAHIKIILVAHDLTPMGLHQLLRLGADDFAPYPLPEGALHEAIARLSKPTSPTLIQAQTSGPTNRNGAVFPVYGLSGGAGATTLAVNLAWEMAQLASANGQRVCLLDLDFQYGTVSTYLDLPRREAIYELLSDTPSMDRDSFSQAMVSFNDKLDVLTAPTDALPLEIVGPEDVNAIISMATDLYDYVIIDMPKTLVAWSETIVHRAHIIFGILEMDMRSAQNTLRFVRTLKAEDLPFEKIRYVLNRAPKFTDLNGKARIKRLSESLNIEVELLLPDGGKPVMQSCDHGLPLSETAAKNPLRKEIAKIALSIHELNTEQAAAK